MKTKVKAWFANERALWSVHRKPYLMGRTVLACAYLIAEAMENHGLCGIAAALYLSWQCAAPLFELPIDA